jgi:hypothetical protein
VAWIGRAEFHLDILVGPASSGGEIPCRACKVNSVTQHQTQPAASLTSIACSRRLAHSVKSANNLKHFLYAFVIALIGYAGFFSCDKYLREKNGPWRITFTTDSPGVPGIIIQEPRLNILNVKIVFPGARTALTNFSAVVVFDNPLKTIPFGKFIFHDLMYLPGTVTLELFGHEIELLPRVLIIDRKEHPWKSGTTISLAVSEDNPSRGTNRP